MINLTNTELTEKLDLRLNFVPAITKILLMGIISVTEACATDLENNSKETDAKCLRRKVSHIFHRNWNIKLWDNLSKSQRKSLMQIKNNKEKNLSIQ